MFRKFWLFIRHRWLLLSPGSLAIPSEVTWHWSFCLEIQLMQATFFFFKDLLLSCQLNCHDTFIKTQPAYVWRLASESWFCFPDLWSSSHKPPPLCQLPKAGWQPSEPSNLTPTSSPYYHFLCVWCLYVCDVGNYPLSLFQLFIEAGSLHQIQNSPMRLVSLAGLLWDPISTFWVWNYRWTATPTSHLNGLWESKPPSSCCLCDKCFNHGTISLVLFLFSNLKNILGFLISDKFEN